MVTTEEERVGREGWREFKVVRIGKLSRVKFVGERKSHTQCVR